MASLDEIKSLIDDIFANDTYDIRYSRLEWMISEYLNLVPDHTIKPVGWDYDWYRANKETYHLWKATDSEGRQVASWSPESFTRSVDAALWLVKTLGYRISEIECDDFDTWYCHIVKARNNDSYGVYSAGCYGPSLPLTIVKAVVATFKQ